MTANELRAKISELEQAAQTFDASEKPFRLSDIDQLRIRLDGLAIADVAARMQAISLPDIKRMDTHIAAARDAMAVQALRVSAFNTACGIIKGFLGIMV
jgi:hypothetical protein